MPEYYVITSGGRFGPYKSKRVAENYRERNLQGFGTVIDQPIRRELKREGVDEVAKRELTLYEENDSQLVKQREAFIRNQERRIRRGDYNSEKARKLWQYHIDRAARKYSKEAGARKTLFDKKTRESLARDYAGRGERIARIIAKQPKQKKDDSNDLSGDFGEF